MQLFEQLINLLIVGAIVLTVVKTYLTANKIWSRKHEQVVSDSVSVSAQLIGIITSLPFLIKYTLINPDIMIFTNMSIKLILTLFFLMIGIGLWVRAQDHESLWGKVKRSLKMEKKESLDLINALVRPAGAHTMLDVMHRIAMIDKHLDDRELAYIQAFANRWNIKIDFLKAFDAATEEATDQMYIDLRQKVSDYLSISPDKEQAKQFLDIINSLVKVDQNISVEEQFILDEIRGMIDNYIDDGQVTTSYSVIVVPQNREERAAIRALLPDVNPKAEWGGDVYFAGVYNSRPYADMISEKYQALNLFSTVKTRRD